MSTIPADDPTTRLFLRHVLATLAYRAGKAVRGTPEAFGGHRATPLPWEKENARFYAALKALDDHLASGAPILWDPGQVFQGGTADALTHTGQLAMLRRLSGFKMEGESCARRISSWAGSGSSRRLWTQSTNSTDMRAPRCQSS